ncbi:DUF4912 domain-containing protein [Clostridium sp. DL1XJH146]
MHFYDKISIVLMVQGTFDLFCYFSVSPDAIYGFEVKYGVGSWNGSQPILKVKKMVDGKDIEIKSKEINKFDTSSFIKLEEDNIDVFVEYGRKLFGHDYVALASSNMVSTPRSSNSKEDLIYFVELENNQVSTINTEKFDSEDFINESFSVSDETSNIILGNNISSSININDVNNNKSGESKYNFGIRYSISADDLISNNVLKESSFINIEETSRMYSSSDNIDTNSYYSNKDKFEDNENIEFFKQHFYNINRIYKTSSSK